MKWGVSIISKIALKNRILIAFLILPFLEPEIFNFFTKIHMFFLVWECFNLLILIIMFLYKKKASIYVVLILMWRFYLMFITYFENGSLSRAVISRTIFIIGITLVIQIGMNSYPMDTLWGIYFVMICLSIINLISCFKGGILQSNGSPYFLFGLRTRFTDSAIPVTVISLIISWITKKKIFSSITVFTLFVVGLQLLNQWVATGIFVLFILIFLIYFATIGHYRLPPKTSLSAGILFLISIVFFRIQNYFSFIIVNLLHKSLDFHGRIDIWNNAILIIKEKLVTGVGEVGDGGFIPVWWSYKLAPAHDMILQLLHDGGLISSVLLFLIFIYAVNRINKLDSVVSNILVAGIIATCLAVLTEVTYYYSYFYILPALCVYSSQLNAFSIKRELQIEAVR